MYGKTLSDLVRAILFSDRPSIMMSMFSSFLTFRLPYQITLDSQPFADTRSSECVSNGAVGVMDSTLHDWDTPGKYPSLSGTPCSCNGSSSMAPSADSSAVGIHSPTFSPFWAEVEKRKKLGVSPALSAITVADFSTYHMEQAERNSGGDRCVEDEKDYMDISSAARDLRELSQMTVDDSVGPDGAQAPSSADMGRSGSGGYTAGRVRGG